MSAQTNRLQGFTLIELLVTIAIIAILVSIAAFALRGAQSSSRDGRRMADLEQIRSALELYRADCRAYPTSLTFGGSLQGSGTPASCDGSYMQKIPQDVSNPGRTYSYTYSASTNAYVVCAALETDPVDTYDVTACGSCGSGVDCNYTVTNP